MTDRVAAAEQDRLAEEIAHWRFACDALADLDAVASPAAWASLEEYLRMRVRDRLAAAVAELSREAASVAAASARGGAPADVRQPAAAAASALPASRDRSRLLRRRCRLADQPDACRDPARTGRDRGGQPRAHAATAGDTGADGDGLRGQGTRAAILRADVRLWTAPACRRSRRSS